MMTDTLAPLLKSIKDEWTSDVRAIKDETITTVRAISVGNSKEINRLTSNVIDHGVKLSTLEKEINRLTSNVIGHGVKLSRMELENRRARNEVRVKLDKSTQKVQNLTDVLGSANERNCRDALGRNALVLSADIPELAVFQKQGARAPKFMASINDLCKHLKFQGKEINQVKSILIDMLKGDRVNIGRKVLCKYISIASKALNMHKGKWISLEIHCLKVSNMLRFTHVSTTYPDILIELQVLRNEAKESKLSVFDKEFLDCVIDLFVITERGDFCRMESILDSTWGLMFFMWTLRKDTPLLRHGCIQLDVAGLITREARVWQAVIGEVKSSNHDLAIGKAKKQLDFFLEIMAYAISFVGGSIVRATKFIFTVLSVQESSELIFKDGDFYLVDLSKLG